MRDPRTERMAEVLVNYSLELKKGDVFLITGSEESIPLVTEVYRQALRAGAHPEVRIAPGELSEIKLKEGSDEQLLFLSPISLYAVKTANAYLSISGSKNLKALSNVDPSRMQLLNRGQSELDRIFIERAASKELRWSTTQFPTNASAQEAGMSLSEYEEFVYGACLLDAADPVTEWKKVNERQKRWVDYLNSVREIRVKSEDTDLVLRVEGRTWENCAGKENFPDGEVFTGPVEDSIEGYIRFSFPAIYHGREVEDIRLEFRKGEVVRAEAAKGNELLQSVLDTDEGSRRVGEFAIGTNPGITRFTKSILFDEKINGTIHLAVGSGYKETGSTNESAIHWDMICDMTRGEMYADGELFYKDGKLLVT